jgi:hypothetical protein
MSESIQLRDPLFKLMVRFANGEMIQHVLNEPLDERLIAPATRYMIISSFSCQNPSECTDVTVVNLRDVSFIKTERATLDQLTTERRMAGLHSTSTQGHDERLPKTLAHVKFV